MCLIDEHDFSLRKRAVAMIFALGRFFMVYFSVIWSKKLAEFIRHIYNFSNFVLGELVRIKKTKKLRFYEKENCQ